MRYSPAHLAPQARPSATPSSWVLIGPLICNCLATLHLPQDGEKEKDVRPGRPCQLSVQEGRPRSGWGLSRRLPAPGDEGVAGLGKLSDGHSAPLSDEVSHRSQFLRGYVDELAPVVNHTCGDMQVVVLSPPHMPSDPPTPPACLLGLSQPYPTLASQIRLPCLSLSPKAITRPWHPPCWTASPFSVPLLIHCSPTQGAHPSLAAPHG